MLFDITDHKFKVKDIVYITPDVTAIDVIDAITIVTVDQDNYIINYHIKNYNVLKKENELTSIPVADVDTRMAALNLEIIKLTNIKTDAGSII